MMGTKKDLPLLATADPPPLYGAAVPAAAATKKTKMKKSGTVPVTIDDARLYLPPPDPGCFLALKYPELVAAVGPLAPKGLNRCALKITRKTVKPWFGQPYKKVESVVVVRDINFETRQKALMKMDLQTIRKLAENCRVFAHAGDWYETILARYNNAVAEFERKYGDECDAF